MKKIKRIIMIVFFLSFFSIVTVNATSCRRETPDLNEWKLIREDRIFENKDGREPESTEDVLYMCCRDITMDYNPNTEMWTTHCDQYAKIKDEVPDTTSCDKPSEENWVYVKHESNYTFDHSSEGNGVKIICCKEGKMGTQQLWGCDFYDWVDEPTDPEEPSDPDEPEDPDEPDEPDEPDDPDYKIEDASIGGLCNKSSYRKPMKFLGTLVNFLKYIVPIAIILFGVMDLYKAVTASKDDEIKKATKSIVVRVIAGVFIFFLPGIVQFILNMVNEWSDYKNDWCCCTECLLNPDCDVNSCNSNSCHIEGTNK